ncbi:MAG: hypothetical protein R3C56_28995 [Pirellulaceae bacterium]
MSLTAMLVVLSQSTTAQGDIFRYRDGRVISGTVTDEKTMTVHEAPVRVWAVEVEKGVFIRVLESELVRNGYEPLSEGANSICGQRGECRADG